MADLIKTFAEILEESIEGMTKEEVVDNISDYRDITSGSVNGLIYDEDIEKVYKKHESEILSIVADSSAASVADKVGDAWNHLFDEVSAEVLSNMVFEIKLVEPIYKILIKQREFVANEFDDAFVIQDDGVLYEDYILEDDELRFELQALAYYNNLPVTKMYKEIDKFFEKLEELRMYGDEEYKIVPDTEWEKNQA